MNINYNKYVINPILLSPSGEFGTLSAVSAVTKAVKSLSENGIKTIGYNGLMLPVMEDIVLAERAAQTPPTFTLRDLLTFSAVCGVGLDTVPVPGRGGFILQNLISLLFCHHDSINSVRLLLSSDLPAGCIMPVIAIESVTL